MGGWRAWPVRQLTGTPHVFRGYVGRDKPERKCHDGWRNSGHRNPRTAMACAEQTARRLNLDEVSR